MEAVDGAVEVDGPDAVDVTLTPEAAEETSDRLLRQAFKARGQTRLKRDPHQPKRCSQDAALLRRRLAPIALLVARWFVRLILTFWSPRRDSRRCSGR